MTVPRDGMIRYCYDVSVGMPLDLAGANIAVGQANGRF